MSNQCEQWDGRLKAVKREIKGVEERLDSRMDGLEERLDACIIGLNDRIIGLESKIDKILEALARK